MIFATGDTHGYIDIPKIFPAQWPEGQTLSKSDYLIICGDFGLVWDAVPSPNSQETYYLNWLSNQPWTTLFVDGNHERIPRLFAYPEVDLFGSKAGKITDSIYHLKRGNIYTIEGKTFFAFGGARSEDKLQRIIGVSWWREELPSYEEYHNGLYNLSQHGNKVDYIITHTAPAFLIHQISGFRFNDTEYDLTKFFDQINQEIEYSDWYLGHLHINEDFGKFHALYDKIVRIA